MVLWFSIIENTDCNMASLSEVYTVPIFYRVQARTSPVCTCLLVFKRDYMENQVDSQALEQRGRLSCP